MFLCLVLLLPEWRPIVDSVLDLNPKYEVSSEMFDPSFFPCKERRKRIEPCEQEEQGSTYNMDVLPEVPHSFRANFFQRKCVRYAMFGIKIFSENPAF